MEKTELFRGLVEFHSRYNLERCLPYINNGRLSYPWRAEPLEEAFDENELCKGVLVIANGETLVDRLVGHGLAKVEDIGEFSSVYGIEEFIQHVSSQKNFDGAYIYDGINKRIAKVSELNNNPENLPYNSWVMKTSLPYDFVDEDGKLNPLEHIGMKTRLAIKIPHAFKGVEAYQIKRSAYTSLGLGKVTHFTHEGLMEEFFFRPCGNEIEGVYRSYKRVGGEVVREEELCA